MFYLTPLKKPKGDGLVWNNQQWAIVRCREDEFDRVLSQCTDVELSKYYQPNEPTNQCPTVASDGSPNYKAVSSPAYSSPVHSAISIHFILNSDSELHPVKENAVPKHAAKNTTWAVSICIHSHSTLSAVVYSNISRNIDHNSTFSANHKSLGFARHLTVRWRGYNILASSVDRKQAEPLTVEEKNSLWSQGLLGESSPQTLTNTLLFLCGMHFTLESGQEYQSLQVTHVELVEPSEGSIYLICVHREFAKTMQVEFHTGRCNRNK